MVMKWEMIYTNRNECVWKRQDVTIMKPDKSRQQGIQSIEIGARLLQALAQTARPQMLKELAATARMPPAKAHRYLVSFVRMGLVERQADTGLYDLGAFALQLGLGALARLDVVTAAAPALARLCEVTGQTSAIAVWANQGATIVRWLGADTPVAASLRVGSVVPLTRSATGGVFLAYLPPAATRAFVRRELRQNRRAPGPATFAQAYARAARHRRQGYVHTSGFIAGISGLAVPVFDHAGRLALALVALGYAGPFEAGQRRILAELRREAATVAKRLGYEAAKSRPNAGGY